MELSKIVFVDSDEDYLMTLVLKFINKLKDNVEITMITDTQYLQEYIEQPHDIGILVINEKLYSQSFERYNIDYIYFLNEVIDDAVTEPTQGNYIYKYSSVNEIYSRIASLSNLEAKFLNGKKSTMLIMIYSPIGGCGKTFTAIGIAKALSLLNKKVLYLNLETIQSFNYLLTNKSYLGISMINLFSSEIENVTELLSSTTRNEGFDYIPPFGQSTSSLNITFDTYHSLIHKLIENKSYEYIILDTSTEFDENKARLMYECDKVFLITNQDNNSLWKMDCFLNNIDYSNHNKFLFICNNYDTAEANMIDMGNNPTKYSITDYIKKVPHKGEYINTSNIAENSSFQKIVYYLL